MPFLSLRANFGAALCALLLAGASSLSRAHTVDLGDFQTKTNIDPRVYLNYDIRAYAGCLTPGVSYRFSAQSQAITTITPKHNWTSGANVISSPRISGSSTDRTPKPFTASIAVTVSLTRSGTVIDSQTINLSVTGQHTYNPDASATTHNSPPIPLVFTLKPDGPVEGKTRAPQINPGEEDEGELVDLFSYIPNFQTGVNGQTGAPNKPISIDVGGRTAQIPVGASWQQIRVPTGSSGSIFIPTWLPGNSGRTGAGASNPAFLYQPDFPGPRGDPPFPAGISVTSASNGTTVSGGFPGDTFDLRFPKGYKPEQVDLMPEKQPTSTLDVDPCFADALDDLGMPPPGMEPGEPGLPPGVTPGGTLPLPGIPGTIPGLPPGTILPPGIELPPGIGDTGGGSGGGSVDLPSGGGDGSGSGGGSVVTPGPPTPDGKAPSEMGEGLPDDDAAEALTDKIAGKFNDAVGKIQGAVGGLMGKGSIQNTSFGQSSTWIVSFTVAGQHHSFEIPTTHASLIRGVLHVLLVTIFLYACYNLLLGK